MDITNKTELVRAFIKDNPGATIRETVKATGTSRALVSIVRKQEALRTGEPPRPGSKRRSSDDSFSTPTSEIVERVLGGSAIKLTAAQQAQLFSELAVHPDLHPRDRAVMLNGLRALEAASASTEQIGPRAPLTPEDKIHRLSLLLEACGEELASLAWDRAFPETQLAQATQEAS